MRRSIATVSLSGTLRQKLEAAAAARFDAVELFEPDFTSFQGSAETLRTICEDLGLGIALFQPFRDFEGMPEASFQRSLERAERKFDLMQRLDAPLMLVCSNVSPLALGDSELAAAQLHALAERAARRNLRIGYEALAWGRHVRLWRQAWDIVERTAHPHLGLVLDSFHTLSLDDDASGIAQLPGERIFFLQMADAPRLRLDVIDWARHHRNFPGQGQLDVIGFFEQVVRAGYDGPLSLEVFNDVFRETPNRRVAVDAMRSLLWLESQARERLAVATDGAAVRALASRLLFAPPPMPAFSGWSFVEFAVDAHTAAALGELLVRMGFHRAGRHRSKAVTLYRQGGINLVVNEGGHALARSRFESFGASVCAVGLRVGDAQAARNRAIALQSARFDPPVGAGEQALPSVIAPGGLVLHFIDDGLRDDGLYERDFVLETAPSPAVQGGLQCVDHVGVALAPDRVDTWVLFCRAVLGLEAGDSLKLADPHGLVRSFGLADAARGLRLLVNVSLGAQTRMAREVGAGGGVVVQHLAFACEDIFASVQALRDAGVAFVAIPENYHDDLATRFDLPELTLAQMRALGVLFDRTPEGDYLHACTERFAGRFAFEIVQRASGYDGYGGPNAAVLLSAQAQRADAEQRV
jgi:4-hydroxyphenylpyruvate dioxygenase